MRTFNSYEAVETDIHYYAPRETLIEQAYQKLLGDNPQQGGHYLTIWAPRQTGKTWVMEEVMQRFQKRDDFEVAMLSMQGAEIIENDAHLLKIFIRDLSDWFQRELPAITTWDELQIAFSKSYFPKPLILILDEFDALDEEYIDKFARQFRKMYAHRKRQKNKTMVEKDVRLHGLALIGVRSVLGIENATGSPFNVQRSVHIPNLTFEEVDSLFHWYEQENGQTIHQDVIDQIYEVFRGQPGLTCWFGEMLTEQYNSDQSRPIDLDHFKRVYLLTLYALPNNNILNLVSKARQPAYKPTVLELFRTGEKVQFSYDKEVLNFLYMNGVLDWELGEEGEEMHAKFPSPFVQRRLFNAFAQDIFPQMGELHEPLIDLSHVITRERLHVVNLMRLYEEYFQTNRDWLLKGAPLRTDLRVYEAVYHFNLFSYLELFLRSWKGKVIPEFPTGNGQIDLVIDYAEKRYGIEIKSFRDDAAYREALIQSIHYAQRLGIQEVVLVSFIERVSEEIRTKYEAPHTDPQSGIVVFPVLVQTMAP